MQDLGDPDLSRTQLGKETLKVPHDPYSDSDEISDDVVLISPVKNAR